MRHPTRTLIVICVAVTTMFAGGLNAAVAQDADVIIDVSPSVIDIDLGDRTDIELTITNTGNEPLSDAFAHIDVVDLDSEESADAEDWSSVLNRSIPTIAPGESATITWDIQPITPGTYTLYAVALSADSAAVAVTDTVTINVADKRSLNPNGILPVAVGAPLLVGAALAFRFRRHRVAR